MAQVSKVIKAARKAKLRNFVKWKRTLPHRTREYTPYSSIHTRNTEGHEGAYIHVSSQATELLSLFQSRAENSREDSLYIPHECYVRKFRGQSGLSLKEG